MIIEAINGFYASRAKEAQDDFRFRVRPSNLGDCLRKSAMLLAGVEREPLAPESSRVFEHGHARGARLEEIARHIWPDAITQMPVEIPVPWGAMPGTVDLWIPSLMAVVDWKTVSVFGFANLDVEGVSEDYQLQIHAYRKGIENLFSSRPYIGLQGHLHAVLVYEAKDSDARKGVRAGELKEIEVPYTDELEAKYQWRLQEYKALLAAKAAGTLDPFAVPGLPKDSWKCRVEKDGKTPKYCAIGPLRGKCHV
jgi:hypothetical protein